jgi:hypothetical protein
VANRKVATVIDFNMYREIPEVKQALTLLDAKAYTVPFSVRKELHEFLTSTQKSYLPASTDNIRLSGKLAARMATVQANRDRAILLLDRIHTVHSRIKHLLAEVRVHVLLQDDIAAISPVKTRDLVVDGILRPLLQRHDFVSDMKDLATSVMYNTKSALDVSTQIAQLHQMHMRLR